MIKYALFGTGADELRALREIGNKKLAFLITMRQEKLMELMYAI